jgi:hypothetical protein
MFCVVFYVFVDQIWGPNGFAQGSEAIEFAMIITNESFGEATVPSSRCCTGVYQPNNPWSSCFSTHQRAGKQTAQISLFDTT